MKPANEKTRGKDSKGNGRGKRSRGARRKSMTVHLPARISSALSDVRPSFFPLNDISLIPPPPLDPSVYISEVVDQSPSFPLNNALERVLPTPITTISVMYGPSILALFQSKSMSVSPSWLASSSTAPMLQSSSESFFIAEPSLSTTSPWSVRRLACKHNLAQCLSSILFIRILARVTQPHSSHHLQFFLVSDAWISPHRNQCL